MNPNVQQQMRTICRASSRHPSLPFFREKKLREREGTRKEKEKKCALINNSACNEEKRKTRFLSQNSPVVVRGKAVERSGAYAYVYTQRGLCIATVFQQQRVVPAKQLPNHSESGDKRTRNAGSKRWRRRHWRQLYHRSS